MLGVDIPKESFTGICVAIIHRKNDDDDSLVVVPSHAIDIVDAAIVREVFFQEQWFDSVVVR